AELLLEGLDRGRAGDRADLLDVVVLGLLDLRVALGNKELLPGDEVGTGLTDDLPTLVGDGVRREHDVDPVVLQERLTVVGDRLGPLGVLRVDAELWGDGL